MSDGTNVTLQIETPIRVTRVLVKMGQDRQRQAEQAFGLCDCSDDYEHWDEWS